MSGFQFDEIFHCFSLFEERFVFFCFRKYFFRVRGIHYTRHWFFSSVAGNTITVRTLVYSVDKVCCYTSLECFNAQPSPPVVTAELGHLLEMMYLSMFTSIQYEERWICVLLYMSTGHYLHYRLGWCYICYTIYFLMSRKLFCVYNVL